MMIIDISHHQPPSRINYDKLAKQVDLVIIRTQYGSLTIDRHYKTHHREFQKRGVPTAAYAWVRGVSENDMRVEARDFYNRTKEFNPTFWFLDVEEKSMQNMRKGVKAYVDELRKLGAKKVGVYIGHHLYKSFNIDTNDFDAVWIPHYGKNDGTPNSKPLYPCDLHQYTDKGRLVGYSGNLDLNRIISDKPLSYFTDGSKGKVTNKHNGAKNPSSKPKNEGKTISQMANEVIAGKHGQGHEARRKSLGISKSEYEKVRAEVNKRLGVSAPKPKPKPKKSISQMAAEIIQGKHGNGHEQRRKSLGIDKATYEKVRAEVNRRLK